jgi:hypothetical protein
MSFISWGDSGCENLAVLVLSDFRMLAIIGRMWIKSPVLLAFGGLLGISGEKTSQNQRIKTSQKFIRTQKSASEGSKRNTSS